MNAVRVGIIGIGNMGTAHAKCIYSGKIEGMTLAAVCDIRPNRLEFCRENFENVPRFDDAECMLRSGQIDAVIIAVPHRLHTHFAKIALQVGLHVLVEKPVDVTITKARELNALAQQSDRVFGIMFNQRTNPLFVKAREIVQSGQLGELKRSVWIITNWYRTQFYYDSGSWRATWAGEGGGVLLNQCPHQLDLWQWICGMPTSVTAFCDVAKYHHIEVEDDVTVFTRYANGATGTFITSTGECPGTNRLEISGDRGKLVLEDGKLKWWRLNRAEREICFTEQHGFVQPQTDYEEILPDTPETAHAGILQNFTNAILKGEALLAPGIEGINELTISNAAYLSAWKGGAPVQIPFDNGEFDRLLQEKAEKSVFKESHDEATGEGYSPRWQVRW